MDKNFTKNSKLTNWVLVIVGLFFIGAIAIVGRTFIYPVCMAILFSYLIYPLANFLEKRLKIRVLATIISIIIALGVVAGLLFFLFEQLSNFVDNSSSILQQAKENIQNLEQYLNDTTPLTFNSKNSLNDKLVALFSGENSSAGKVLNATTGTLVHLGLQPVYVFFMLSYRDHFKEFLYKITDQKNHDRLKTILGEISSITKNYVSGVFIVVLILCVLNSIGLMIVGIEYAIMFGILSAIMNFIPYFGTLVGGAIPLLFALASDEPRNAVGVLVLFGIIQFTENNILTPNITGGRVAINPLFTIFIIIIGGMAWGIPGMFVSVPLLGMFKVVCSHIESLQPVAFVISPKDSQTAKGLKNIKKLFNTLIK